MVIVLDSVAVKLRVSVTWAGTRVEVLVAVDVTVETIVDGARVVVTLGMTIMTSSVHWG